MVILLTVFNMCSTEILLIIFNVVVVILLIIFNVVVFDSSIRNCI